MNSINEKEIKKSVTKGANWMDENYPGWAVNIDLELFDMGNSEYCVIGFTLGDYNNLPQLSTKKEDWPYNRGFNLNVEDWDYEDENFAILNGLWTEEIQRRVS